jgi:transposase
MFHLKTFRINEDYMMEICCEGMEKDIIMEQKITISLKDLFKLRWFAGLLGVSNNLPRCDHCGRSIVIKENKCQMNLHLTFKD